MNNLDALTLQLLTSKKVYNNYLSTTDKDAAQKNQEYKDFVLNNQQRIKDTISIYLKDPFTQITTELDENMENLLKSLWYHFETLDREAKQKDDETDDEFDTMFYNMNDNCTNSATVDPYEKQSLQPVKQSNHSYFGKNIQKTQGTLDVFMAAAAKPPTIQPTSMTQSTSMAAASPPTITTSQVSEVNMPPCQDV